MIAIIGSSGIVAADKGRTAILFSPVGKFLNRP